MILVIPNFSALILFRKPGHTSQSGVIYWAGLKLASELPVIVPNDRTLFLYWVGVLLVLFPSHSWFAEVISFDIFRKFEYMIVGGHNDISHFCFRIYILRRTIHRLSKGWWFSSAFQSDPSGTLKLVTASFPSGCFRSILENKHFSLTSNITFMFDIWRQVASRH